MGLQDAHCKVTGRGDTFKYTLPNQGSQYVIIVS